MAHPQLVQLNAMIMMTAFAPRDDSKEQNEQIASLSHVIAPDVLSAPRWEFRVIKRGLTPGAARAARDAMAEFLEHTARELRAVPL